MGNAVVVVLVLALCLGVVASTVFAIGLTIPGEDLARVAVGATVDIVPVGLMRLWALSTGVSVPIGDIVGVTVLDRTGGRYWRPAEMRLPGSYFPRRICAGHYRGRRTHELWFAARAMQVVAIDVAPGSRAGVTRVAFQVADPQAVASTIERARA